MLEHSWCYRGTIQRQDYELHFITLPVSFIATSRVVTILFVHIGHLMLWCLWHTLQSHKMIKGCYRNTTVTSWRVMKGSEKSKRNKLSKRVSKLKSDSKSSSAFHSSIYFGIVVVNAVPNDFQHLVHFIELRSASTWLWYFQVLSFRHICTIFTVK